MFKVESVASLDALTKRSESWRTKTRPIQAGAALRGMRGAIFPQCRILRRATRKAGRIFRPCQIQRTIPNEDRNCRPIRTRHRSRLESMIHCPTLSKMADLSASRKACPSWRPTRVCGNFQWLARPWLRLKSRLRRTRGGDRQVRYVARQCKDLLTWNRLYPRNYVWS
jgi:hypothetical protein